MFLSYFNFFKSVIYVLVCSVMFLWSSALKLCELPNWKSAIDINIGLLRQRSFGSSDSNFLFFSEHVIPPDIAGLNSVWRIFSTSCKNSEMFGIVLMI